MFRLAIASLAFGLVGCLAEDGAGDEAIFISKAVAASDDCSFSSTESEPFIGHGQIYIGSPLAYRFHPQMISRIDALPGETVQKTILIHGARVELEFADSSVGTAVPANQKKFTSLFSAPLAPNGGITDGGFDIIPEGALAAMFPLANSSENFEAEVIAKVTVFGDLAGEEVTSQVYRFPVTVCENCITAAFGLPAFPTCPVMAPGRQGNACNPFQDGIVDCCVNGGNLECPASVVAP